MAGAGQRAAAGDGVVDRVDAGGADFPGGVCVGVAGRRAFLEVETDDDVVEPGEQFVGGQVDVGEGAYRGAQPSHGRRRVDAVADDVTDDQCDPGAGQRNHVEPVAAHARLGVGRQVAGGDVQGRRLGYPPREHAALQGECGRAFA